MAGLDSVVEGHEWIYIYIERESEQRADSKITKNPITENRNDVLLSLQVVDQKHEEQVQGVCFVAVPYQLKVGADFEKSQGKPCVNGVYWHLGRRLRGRDGLKKEKDREKEKWRARERREREYHDKDSDDEALVLVDSVMAKVHAYCEEGDGHRVHDKRACKIR